MRRLSLTLILLLFLPKIILSSSKIDYSEDWLNSELSNSKINKNVTDKILQYNMSDFWITKSHRASNGAIGNDYHRIEVRIESVKRHPENNNIYLAKGKSKVRTNICDFKGKIEIVKIVQYSKVKSLDDTLKNAIGGAIIGKYVFEENIKQKHTGIFRGVVSSYWYLDTLKNVIHFNELETFSDNYKNNTFIGIWESYVTGKQKLCMWGDYRIPYLKELYLGAGEIYINSKYKKNGWEEYGNEWARDKNGMPYRTNKWW